MCMQLDMMLCLNNNKANAMGKTWRGSGEGESVWDLETGTIYRHNQ